LCAPPLARGLRVHCLWLKGFVCTASGSRALCALPLARGLRVHCLWLEGWPALDVLMPPRQAVVVAMVGLALLARGTGGNPTRVVLSMNSIRTRRGSGRPSACRRGRHLAFRCLPGSGRGDGEARAPCKRHGRQPNEGSRTFDEHEPAEARADLARVGEAGA
jgi:hypothetical protein